MPQSPQGQQVRRNPAQPLQQAAPQPSAPEPQQPEQDPFAEQETGGSTWEGEDQIFDLSAVPDQPQYEVLPPGIYAGYIAEVNFGQSQRSGNPMLTWILKAPFEDRERTFYYHTTLSGDGLSRTKRTLTAIGGDQIDLAHFNPNTVGEVLVGLQVRMKLRIQMYEGSRRNSVSELLPAEESFLT